MGKVIVRIPTPLRRMTAGRAEVEVEAGTIEEMIENLDKSYAGTRERLADENGEVRRFVNLFVNDEDIRFLQGRNTPLNDGDAVSIVPAIAGGRA